MYLSPLLFTEIVCNHKKVADDKVCCHCLKEYHQSEEWLLEACKETLKTRLRPRYFLEAFAKLLRASIL